MTVRTRSRQLEYKVFSDVEPYIAKVWCNSTIGDQWCALDNRQGLWTCFWAGPSHLRERNGEAGKYVYRFAEEQDALMFKIRWS